MERSEGKASEKELHRVHRVPGTEGTECYRNSQQALRILEGLSA